MNLLVFPNQLFESHPGFILDPARVILVEDSLFFRDHVYPLRLHKQKLWLHRATMKRFQAVAQSKGFATLYIEYDKRPNALVYQLGELQKSGGNHANQFAVAHPTDFVLEKRLEKAAQELGFELEYLPNPGFLNQPSQNIEYREGKKRWFMADFYKWQRRRLDILMDGDEPRGGKWSFDEENRKKVPKPLLNEIPPLMKIKRDQIDDEAKAYVERQFSKSPGTLDELFYPSSHESAAKWFDHFLVNRFDRFGDYEDAVVEGESWLWHSILTPALNVGLLTPSQVVERTLAFADEHDVPLNSLEGFIRQVIGWREFMRATYQELGVTMRTTNHWNHQRTIPSSFYEGTTGILPIDDVIQRLLATGYCHHIERLMLLGGFMFLCEFHPDSIYEWFMEMFVDSYDWVMVPNVYAMSQHADGGLITTKPYFSGSSYVRKMSHYKKGPWCDVWDGLYWRWIANHSTELQKNPRWAMMCSMAKKMDADKLATHRENAEKYLNSLMGSS